MKPIEEQAAELLATPATLTLRPTVPAMERRMYHINPVLDHGFVRVVDYMGDDSAVVQAARVSYGTGTETPTSDRGLIRYLMSHRHSTPFEMCEIKLHVKLPIFVARQWIRHRTANVNEYSARYSILDKEFYLPHPSQVCEQSKDNKQGRGDVLTDKQSAGVMKILRDDANGVYGSYEELCNGTDDTPGIARELARINLSMNYYTQWYWKVDVHNLLGFLSLRMHPHAQYEIRVYANLINEIVKDWMPHSHEAFVDYRTGGSMMNRMEMEQMRKYFDARPEARRQLVQETEGLSGRERFAFGAKLGSDRVA